MSIADGDHRGENMIPGLLFHHDCIGEHAAVPTDMADGFGKAPIVSVKPVTGMVSNGEFTVRIIGQTMMARFVMGA